MASQYWYDKDPGDEETPIEDPVEKECDKFNQAVRDLLDSEGHLGYSLGKPIFFSNDVLINICIFDPQNELPKDIKAYIQNFNSFKAGEGPNATNLFDHQYDSQSDTYDFSITDEKILKNYPSNMLYGLFNRNGDILQLKSQF